MDILFKLSLSLGGLFFPFILTAQSLTLVSWNIKDFGQSRDDVEMHAIANHIKNADIVLIQEVVAKHPGGVQAVSRLDNELDRMGADWDYMYSNPTRGFSGHISERYAILWKKHKIKVLSEGRLINEVEDIVYREPYMLVVEFEGHQLRLLNYHSRRFDDNPEIEIEAIASFINSSSFKESIILSGDFNMSEDNVAFQSLYDMGFSSTLRNEKTTLKRSCKAGEYTNYAIDNIYYSLKNSLSIAASGVLDFVLNCDDFPEVRDSYSDHLPVYVRIVLR